MHRLRGTGGDLVILEEAAFIDESVFNEVVIPLLEVSNTALVGISTPLDKNNYYSSLVNLVDDQGKRVFHLFEAKRMRATSASRNWRIPRNVHMWCWIDQHGNQRRNKGS